MDISKIISRAGQITWRWKALWLLGLLAALGGGSSGGGGGGGGTGWQYVYQMPRGTEPVWVSNVERWFSAPGAIALLSGLLGLAVLLGLALWVVSIIANGGLIAGVRQAEEEGSTSFRRGWRVGVQRFWTLLGIDLLFGLTLFVLVGLLVGFILTVVMATGGSISSGGARDALPAILLPLFLCGAPLCCGVVILGIGLGVIRAYAQRAAVLENRGTLDALSGGWRVLRQNVGNTLLLVLILVGISIGVGWVIGLLGAAVAGPTLFVFMDHAPTPAELTGVAVGTTIMSLVGLFINAVLTTFTSAIWTLAYRGFTMPAEVPVAAAPALEEPITGETPPQA